jgi:Cyclic nucleotide-binding domain
VLVDVIKRVEVKPGDYVIRQGDIGDRFYIIDSGTFEVRVQQDGIEVSYISILFSILLLLLLHNTATCHKIPFLAVCAHYTSLYILNCTLLTAALLLLTIAIVADILLLTITASSCCTLLSLWE